MMDGAVSRTSSLDSRAAGTCNGCRQSRRRSSSSAMRNARNWPPSGETIERLAKMLATRASAASVHELQRRMEDLQRSFAHQDRAFAEAFERARLLDEQGMDDRRFARRISELLRYDRPIIVGPWTGEVGFELLYWVPFVRWVVTTYGIAPERLFVVSRGGVSSWYGKLAARYADVFSYLQPG